MGARLLARLLVSGGERVGGGEVEKEVHFHWDRDGEVPAAS